VFFKPFLATYVAESVLHRDTVCSHHAIGVDVHNVDVVKWLYKVSACNDLAGFVKGNFGENELVGIANGLLAEDEGAGENYGCSLRRISRLLRMSDEDVRRTSVALQHRRPSCLPRSSIG
jgi:hypothetical protein